MGKGSERTGMGAGLARIGQLDRNMAGQSSTSQHTPQHPATSFPLPSADWHISAFKGMLWAVGTGGEKAIYV